MKKLIYISLSLLIFISLLLPSFLSTQNIQPPTATGQSATPLPEGRWLVVGGEGTDGPLGSVSIWDPQNGTATPLATELVQSRSALEGSAV